MADAEKTTNEPLGWDGWDVKVHGEGAEVEVGKEVASPPAESEGVIKTVDLLVAEEGEEGESWGEEEEEDKGSVSEEMDHPPEVERRLKALKKIQVDVVQTESDFFKEVHELEMKYADKYTGFLEKRREIVLGKYEPTDEDCKMDGESKPDEDGDGGLEEALQQLKLEVEEKKKKGEELIPGIPDFWLTIFQNVDMISDMVQTADLPILKHLTDIKVEMTTGPMGFKLHFHFSPNDFFNDSVLTKTYEMKCDVDEEDPFSFEGPELVKSVGCSIDWKEGKNVTARLVRKRQKHKQTGTVRMVNKTMEIPSFFGFFNPPQMVGGVEMDEEAQLRLTNDFEVGQFIRERIVPRAVLYYTGEAEDDDDDDYEEEEEETETEGENEASASSANAEEEEEEEAE